MKEWAGKIMDLRRVILNIDDLPALEDDLEVFGRKYYADVFFSGKTPGVHLLHDGELAEFSRRRFTHAFSYAGDWEVTKEKTGLDKRRIIRINWILPMIQGLVLGSECWQKLEDFQRKRIICMLQTRICCLARMY